MELLHANRKPNPTFQPQEKQRLMYVKKKKKKRRKFIQTTKQPGASFQLLSRAWCFKNDMHSASSFSLHPQVHKLLIYLQVKYSLLTWLDSLSPNILYKLYIKSRDSHSNRQTSCIGLIHKYYLHTHLPTVSLQAESSHMTRLMSTAKGKSLLLSNASPWQELCPQITVGQKTRKEPRESSFPCHGHMKGEGEKEVLTERDVQDRDSQDRGDATAS